MIHNCDYNEDTGPAEAGGRGGHVPPPPPTFWHRMKINKKKKKKEGRRRRKKGKESVHPVPDRDVCTCMYMHSAVNLLQYTDNITFGLRS